MHHPLPQRGTVQPAVPILIVTPSTPHEYSTCVTEVKTLFPSASSLPSPISAREKSMSAEPLLADEDELYQARNPSNRRRIVLLALSIISLIFLTALVTCHPSTPSISGIHVKRSANHAGLKVRVRLNIGVRNGVNAARRQHPREFDIGHVSMPVASGTQRDEQFPVGGLGAWVADRLQHETGLV